MLVWVYGTSLVLFDIAAREVNRDDPYREFHGFKSLNTPIFYVLSSAVCSWELAGAHNLMSKKSSRDSGHKAMVSEDDVEG